MPVRRLWSCVAGAAILLFAASAGGAVPEAGGPTPTCGQGPTAIEGTIVGTPCDDTIVAPPGVAAVDGGGGDDTIVPAPITGALDCSAGCFLDIGSQTFEGGPGNDVVFGERGNDRLFGGGGNDQLFGGIGDDEVKGGPGDDRLSGGFGHDSIDGEGDDDFVRGDATIDEIVDRGGGTDTLSYSTGIVPGFFNGHSFDPVASQGLPPLGGERGVYLDLSADPKTGNGDNGVAPFGGGVDEVEGTGFEVVIGTAFSDYLVGSDGDETFYGGGGGDVILAGDGADTLRGGADGDHLDGGDGADADAGDGGPGSDRCADVSAASGCERGAGENGVIPRDPGVVVAGLLALEDARAQAYLAGSDEDDQVTATYTPGPPASLSFELGAGSDAQFGTGPSASAGCQPPSGGTLVCPLAKPLDSVVLAGLDGDDVLAANGFPISISVVLAGGDGGDSLTGGDQSEDVLADGTDDDGPGDDTLNALGGDDAVLNNGGKDEVFGGVGNDLFLSDSICDDDVLDGGNGRDNGSWTKFDAAVEVHVGSGGAGEPGAGGGCASGSPGSLVAIEDLEGTPFGDAFYGDGGENQLLGWAGADTYVSGDGNDRILANSGDFDPPIQCGAGTDTALIDFKPFGDVAGLDCENVREAAKNSFRIETELEVPPAPPSEAPPPEALPTVEPPRKPKGPGGGAPSRPNCLGMTRSVSVTRPVRCAVRPPRLRLAGRSALERLEWERWGPRRGVGFGRLVVNARTGDFSTRAKLVVSRSQRCSSRSWYTRMRVSYGPGFHRAYLRQAAVPTPCTARLRRDGDRRGARG
jgi:Ca2+-binding RTX toxin-like protein